MNSPDTELNYSQSAKPQSTPFRLQPQLAPIPLLFQEQSPPLSLDNFTQHFNVIFKSPNEEDTSSTATPLGKTLLQEFERGKWEKPQFKLRRLGQSRKQKTESCIEGRLKNNSSTFYHASKTKRKVNQLVFDQNLNGSTLHPLRNKLKFTPYLEGSVTRRAQILKNTRLQNPFAKKHVSIQLRGESKPIQTRVTKLR